MRIIGLSFLAIALAGALGFAANAPLAAQATDAATQGKRLFIRCAACHAIGPGTGRIGPDLAGVVGRKAGALPGYRYSAAMAKQSFVWNEAALDEWLARPSAVVPGTSMAFAGVSNPADRAALIAYLKKPVK